MSSLSLSQKYTNENIAFSFFKGLLVSMVLSFGLVVLFAFCLKWFEVLNNYIFAGTMVIKAISAGLGAMVAIKSKSGGLVKGMLFGLVYISLAFVVFSFLAGSFSFDNQTLLDFLSCGIIGAIVGIIKVNR